MVRGLLIDEIPQIPQNEDTAVSLLMCKRPHLEGSTSLAPVQWLDTIVSRHSDRLVSIETDPERLAAGCKCGFVSGVGRS